jgi:Fe-S cluster biogenesis protein NfuA
MSTTDIEELGYFEIMPRVAQLYEQLAEYPDRQVVEAVGEMMDLVDAFHREGLGRLVEMIRAWRGEIFLESVSQDEITGEFLSAYDLGEPVDDREMQAAAEAVDAALEEIRPFVESDGGMITVESIKDGVVTVRLLGSCDGCPSSSATLTGGLEEALRRHWVNFRRLEVADDAETAPAAPPEPEAALLQIGRKKPAAE